jgi:hypothetical protein
MVMMSHYTVTLTLFVLGVCLFVREQEGWMARLG